VLYVDCIKFVLRFFLIYVIGGNSVSINQGLPFLLNTSEVINNCQIDQTKLSSVSNNESPPTLQDNFSDFHCDIDRLLVKSFGAHTYEDKMLIVLRGKTYS